MCHNEGAQITVEPTSCYPDLEEKGAYYQKSQTISSPLLVSCEGLVQVAFQTEVWHIFVEVTPTIPRPDIVQDLQKRAELFTVRLVGSDMLSALTRTFPFSFSGSKSPPNTHAGLKHQQKNK